MMPKLNKRKKNCMQKGMEFHHLNYMIHIMKYNGIKKDHNVVKHNMTYPKVPFAKNE